MHYRTFTNKHGVIKTVTKNGLQSIDDKPSFIKTHAYHTVEQWHSKNKLHRRSGPAVISRNLHDPNNVQYQWWIRGELYSFKDFLKVADISDDLKVELILNYG